MGTDEKRRGKDAATLSGGHLCHVCGYQYPNPNPSAKLRRSHRKHCGKTAPAAVEEEEEEEGALVGVPASDREERNAGEQTSQGGKGGEAEGKTEADGGKALLGSAREVGDLVESSAVAEHASSNGNEVHHIICEINENGQINCMNSEHGSPDDKNINSELSKKGLVDRSNNPEIVNEDNEADFPIACTFGSQNGVAKHCSELAPATVTNPAIREDSFDEYHDASPFLQTDSDGALPSSEFPVETNNWNTILSGSSADEISLRTNEVGNDLDKGTPNLAGPEVSLKLGVPYESCVNVVSNDTDMVHNEPDKRFCLSEPIGDLDASSLNEAHSVALNTDSQTTYSKNMQGTMDDTMHVLDNMYEASPIPESAEASNVQLEILIDSSFDTMPNQNELMVVYTENNPTDSSTELSTQNWPLKDTSGVQLPIENLCQNKICSTVAIDNKLPPTTYVDDTLNFINRDSSSDLDFTSQARTQLDNIEQGNVAEENLSLQNSGFTEEEVCNKQIDPKVPTEDQFPKSQKHVVSAVGQISCGKNPFDLDDARNDELFELPNGSCYLEIPNADVSRQEVDSVSLIVDQPTVSNRTRMAEAQPNHNTNDILPAASSSSEKSHPVCPKDMSISSSSELVMNTSLADASLGHHIQEDEAHTNGIPFVLHQVAPMESDTVCTNDISALSTGVEENTHTKDTTAKETTAVPTTNDIEMKHADDITTTNTYAINAEANKVTEDTDAERNVVQCCNVEQNLIDNTKDVSVVQIMSNLEENKLTEDPSTKEMNVQVNADDLEGKWQTDDTEKMKAIGCTENFEEKMVAQGNREKEMIAAQCTEKLDENRQINDTVGQEGNNHREEITVTGGRLNSGRVRVPLKVLLAEASAENKVNKPSAKERVLSFRRRVSKNDNSPAKSGAPRYGSHDHQWNSPAKLPRNKDTDENSEGRKQSWMPFICCHSVR